MKNMLKNKFVGCFLVLACIVSLTACSGSIYKQKKLTKDALTLMGTDMYEEANKKLSEALELGKSDDKVYMDILKCKSLCEFKLGDYEESIKALNELLEKEKSSDNDYKALLVINLSRQAEDMEKAGELLLELTKDKNRSSAYEEALDEFLRALLVQKKSGNYTPLNLEEIRSLNEEQYKKEKTVSNTNNMGMFAYFEEDYDKALVYFEEAKKMLEAEADSESAKLQNIKKSVLFNLASTYEYKLEPQKAIDLFEEYIQTYGEDEEVRHELIFLKSRVKE